MTAHPVALARDSSSLNPKAATSSFKPSTHTVYKASEIGEICSRSGREPGPLTASLRTVDVGGPACFASQDVLPV
jgi:hypothetical protein